MIQEHRSVFVVDLENACGGSALVPQFQKKVRLAIKRLPHCKNSLTVYSTGPNALEQCPQLPFDWHDARFVPGFGVDGADHALISVIRDEPAVRRSSEIILVSGDHIFAEPVQHLKKLGIRVTVVAQFGTVSQKLAQLADCLCWLPNFARSASRSGLNNYSSVTEIQ